MNPVLILARNNLELTKRCIASINAQDIPTSIFVIDNDSADQTEEWLSSDEYKGVWQRFSPQLSVSEGWNFGLNELFYGIIWKAEHVLCPNADTVLPSWFYRELLSYNVPFVTGVSVGSMEEIAHQEPRKGLAPYPDFSAWLMRRSVWETVGEFNSEMRLYASDCAWHIDAHRKGIPLWNSGIGFFHERSSTLKNAPPRERREIELQADADRDVFKSIYGYYPGEPGYADLFK